MEDKNKMEDNKKVEDKKKDFKETKEGGFSEWIGGIMGEFKRITWPDRKTLIKTTITVIATSGIFGGIIVGFDFALSAGYNALVTLISG